MWLLLPSTITISDAVMCAGILKPSNSINGIATPGPISNHQTRHLENSSSLLVGALFLDLCIYARRLVCIIFFPLCVQCRLWSVGPRRVTSWISPKSA